MGQNEAITIPKPRLTSLPVKDLKERASLLMRSLQVNFPRLLELKFSLTRRVRMLLKRPFEDDFRALKFFPQSDGNLYLDVGANRGQSADAILMYQRNIRLHMFEPNTDLVKKLERQYGLEPQIHIHSYGLGSNSTEATLFVPYYKSWMFDGLASFDYEEAAGWLQERIAGFDARELSVKERACQIIKLDDLHIDPFFIKLDVQGFELEALRGGARTVRKYRPILLIEAPTHDLSAFLHELNYTPYAFRGDSFCAGQYGELNTFFMTPDKASIVCAAAKAGLA